MLTPPFSLIHCGITMNKLKNNSHCVLSITSNTCSSSQISVICLPAAVNNSLISWHPPLSNEKPGLLSPTIGGDLLARTLLTGITAGNNGAALLLVSDKVSYASWWSGLCLRCTGVGPSLIVSVSTSADGSRSVFWAVAGLLVVTCWREFCCWSGTTWEFEQR